MKESDAKTKWCPMVRLSINSEMSWDNRGNDFHDPNCIGSDCMMWEYYHKSSEYGDCELKGHIADIAT